MGAAFSSSHVVSVTPSGSGDSSSHSSPAPVWGPTHGRQSSLNCSNVSPSHGLSSQTASLCIFSTGCPSGTGCSSMGSPRDQKPCQQTCSGMGSCLQGSTSPGRNLLQRRLPMGSQPSSGIHLLLRGVPSMDYGWVSSPPWTSIAAVGQPASPWSSSQAAEESLL